MHAEHYDVVRNGYRMEERGGHKIVVSKDEAGRPGPPQVFLARGDQGVNYRRNVWHHPLMALDAPSDFLVVDRDGPGNNLEEFFFDTPFIIGAPAP